MLISLVTTAGRPSRQTIMVVHSMLKGSSLVGIVVLMDTVLPTVPSQETKPILIKGRSCGKVRDMSKPDVGKEEETVTIDKMVVGMEEEEVAKIIMARNLVPALLTRKSLQSKEKTTRKRSMVQLGIGAASVNAGRRHMELRNIEAKILYN
jgi:hypothetical protein